MPRNTFKLATFADLHLGKPSSPGAAWARTELDRAALNGARVIVFTGDLFDRKHASPAAFHEGVDLFTWVSHTLRLPLLYIWGNHDVASGLIPHFPHIPGSYSPNGSGVESLDIPGVPLRFHAANVEADPDPRTLIDDFPVADQPGHIGVFHTSLTGEYSKKDCLPSTHGQLRSKGYSAWLLGHVHRKETLQESPYIGWMGTGHLITLEVPVLPE